MRWRVVEVLDVTPQSSVDTSPPSFVIVAIVVVFLFAVVI